MLKRDLPHAGYYDADMVLHYLHTCSNGKIWYYTSDMKLVVYYYVDLDTAYLVVSKAKSYIAGFFYCSNMSCKQTFFTSSKYPPLNWVQRPRSYYHFCSRGWNCGLILIIIKQLFTWNTRLELLNIRNYNYCQNR